MCHIFSIWLGLSGHSVLKRILNQLHYSVFSVILLFRNTVWKVRSQFEILLMFKRTESWSTRVRKNVHFRNSWRAKSVFWPCWIKENIQIMCASIITFFVSCTTISFPEAAIHEVSSKKLRALGKTPGSTPVVLRSVTADRKRVWDEIGSPRSGISLSNVIVSLWNLNDSNRPCVTNFTDNDLENRTGTYFLLKVPDSFKEDVDFWGGYRILE